MSIAENPTELLEAAGIKPTANRVLVLRALIAARSPMSLVELETELQTVDRSSILRVLTLFLEQKMLHKIEDGRGIEKYEICHGCCGAAGHGHSDASGDQHPHFYCERCNRVFCFEQLSIPEMPLPDAFEVTSVNFMFKGICPDCKKCD